MYFGFSLLVMLSNVLNGFSVPKEPNDSGQPNFIIIYTDDLGYNDLSCFGSKLIKTPHVNKMEQEGIKLTSFYVGAPLCGPGRVSLMTGCYPLRPSIPEVVIRLQQLAENMREDLGDKGRLGKGWRGTYRWEYENPLKN